MSIANVTTPFVFDELLKSIRLVTENSTSLVVCALFIILVGSILMIEYTLLTGLL